MKGVYDPIELFLNNYFYNFRLFTITYRLYLNNF